MPRDMLIKIATLLMWVAIGFAVLSLLRGDDGTPIALFCLGMAFITWLKRRELEKERQRD